MELLEKAPKIQPYSHENTVFTHLDFLRHFQYKGLEGKEFYS